MNRILATDLAQHANACVKVRGWLHTLRAKGKINFLILRDRTGLIQVVIQDKATLDQMAPLQPGSVLSVTGKVMASLQTHLGVEIVDPVIVVEVPITEVPVVEYNKPEIPSDLEHILDHRPMSLRNRKIQAVFKIQAELAHAYRLFMRDKMHAVEYFAPNIIGASSEGGAEFFNVDYFGYPATLAQSSQLYKQIMVGVNERVFALMPFFRAEPSQTARHLAEGKQFEFEMGFFDHWHEILDVQEACAKFMVKHIQGACVTELELLGHPLVRAPEEVPFPRLTFKEAQELYFSRTGADERNEPDLSPAAERDLCKYAFETFGTDFIFIIDWQLSKRPFYAFVQEADPELSNTFDLLCAGTEITSGGQRRHTYASMIEGILSKGMDPVNFEDYLSIFKYGMPPHGGFGMGLERLTMTFLKLKNIREASLFPSDRKTIAGNRIKAHIFSGGQNIRNEIIRLLKKNGCTYQHLIHNQTMTSEDSAKVRSTALSEGIKSLILRGKQSKKNYQFNISSHKKLDMKKVMQLVGEKCEFEDASVILERYGLEIGGIPPFGPLLRLDTYYDQAIFSEARAAFNCGLLTESIVMGSQDLAALVQPKTGNFSMD
jgi:nondiscriminating aspartyl-tRNA synthetase